MAMAGSARAVVGRTTITFTAMAAISTSSLNAVSTLPTPTSSSASFRLPSVAIPPPISCSASSNLPAAISSRLPSIRCQRLLLSSQTAISSRSLSNSIVVRSSSSSATSVDTTGQQQPPSSSPSPAPAAGVESSPGAAVAAAVEVDSLDIRVGRVIKAWKHPEADSLYVEEVDLAEPEGPRTICSGLVSYLSLEELEGRAVLVLANLKARNMRGVKSNGMLLAASNAEHTTVQLLSAPEGSAPGERVWFGEATDQANQSPAGTPNQVQKKKIWETVQPLLKTTEDCVATFQSKPMRTSVGVVKCESLKGAKIS